MLMGRSDVLLFLYTAEIQETIFWKKFQIGILLKAMLFYNYGRSVRPGQLSLFVNLNSLELLYQFQTLHGDFYNNKVRFRKCNKSLPENVYVH